jgi:hypothetical protein
LAATLALVASPEAEDESNGAGSGKQPTQTTARLLFLLPGGYCRGSSTAGGAAASEPGAVGRPCSGATMSRIMLLDDFDTLRSSSLLLTAEDADEGVPQSPSDAAEAEKQKQDHAGNSANDDSGDGACAQGAACGRHSGRASVCSRFCGTRECVAGSCLRSSRSATCRPIWSRELGSDIDTGSDPFRPSTVAWIGYTLAAMGAILKVCATDGTTGNLAGALNGYAGCAIGSHAGGSCRDKPGADGAGISVRLGPCGDQIPLGEKRAHTGAAWDTRGCVAGLACRAAHFVISAAVFGAFF